VSIAKTDEPIERWRLLGTHVVRRDPALDGAQIPNGKGHFRGACTRHLLDNGGGDAGCCYSHSSNLFFFDVAYNAPRDWRQAAVH